MSAYSFRLNRSGAIGRTVCSGSSTLFTLAVGVQQRSTALQEELNDGELIAIPCADAAVRQRPSGRPFQHQPGSDLRIGTRVAELDHVFVPQAGQACRSRVKPPRRTSSSSRVPASLTATRRVSRRDCSRESGRARAGCDPAYVCG